MTLNIKQLLEGEGYNLEEERERAGGDAHAHSRHDLDDGRIIIVEWEAKQLHEEFTRVLTGLQNFIIGKIVDAVPMPGQDEVLTGGEGHKIRGAVAIRLISKVEHVVRLRITH